MGWIAIAATVDNLVIAANNDITVLEQISEMDFGTIVKIYGLSDGEISQLKNGNLDFRIRFNNLRSTYLEPFDRPQEIKDLSRIYAKRAEVFMSMKGRFEHALNKHRTVLSHQVEIYQMKYQEARDIAGGGDVVDGFVHDYATENGMELLDAANLIIAKHEDKYQHLRKIELLRLRHFRLLKMARSQEDFDHLAAELDKDFFINMLM